MKFINGGWKRPPFTFRQKTFKKVLKNGQVYTFLYS